MSRYWKQPFALNGDREEIKEEIQLNGEVSVNTGWTKDYELPDEEANSKPVGRDTMNSLFHDVTQHVGDVQRSGVLPWRDDIPYPQGALVLIGGILYKSLRESINNQPQTSPTHWVRYDAAISDVDKMIFGTPYKTFLKEPLAGALFLDGKEFDKSKYPRLAQLFPDGVMPNAQEMYFIGASEAYKLGAKVGQQLLSHNHTAASSQTPGHAHYVGIHGAGSHGHGVSMGASGDHGHTAWTDAQGNHQHTLPFHNGFHHVVPGTIPIHVAAGGSASATEWAGNHGHNVGIAGGGNHTHSLSIHTDGFHGHATDVGEAGGHTHTVTVNNNGTAKNLVDAIAINYMMKAE